MRDDPGEGSASPAKLAASDVLIRLLAAAVPLAFNPFGVLAFEPFKLTLVRLVALGVLGLAATTLWSGARSRPRCWPSQPLVLATLALLIVTAVATACSILPLTSLLGSYDRLQGLATLMALVVIAASVARSRGGRAHNRRFVAGLVDWLIAWSAPVCLYALLQHFQLDPLTWLDRTFGPASTAGSSTALAGYLAMLAPLTLARLVSALNWDEGATGAHVIRRQVGIGFLLGLQLVVLLTTGVRGALLGALASLLSLAMLLLRQRRAGRAPALLLLGLLLAALLALGALNLAPERLTRRVSPFLERLGTIGLQDVTGRERLLVWRAALETSLTGGFRLLVGFGPETQAQSLEGRLPAELINRLPDQRYDRVHNLLLDQLLTSGVLGLAALVALFATVMVRGWRLARASSLAGGITAAIVAHGVESLFAFGTGTTLTVFWLLVGLLAALDRPAASRQESRRCSRAVRLGAAGLIVVLICTGGVVLSPILADLAYRRALAYHGGKDVRGEAAWLSRAARLAPDRDLYPLAEALALSSEAPVERSAARRSALLGAAQAAVERALRLDPLDPYNWLHAGEILETRAQAERNEAAEDAAVEAYRQAAGLSPRRAELHDALGLALLRARRPAEALASFGRASELQGSSAERTAYSGDALRALGQLDGARSRYIAALELDQRSAPAQAGLAELELAEGNGRAALEAARLAARYQSRIWQRQELLADVAAAEGEWDEAIDAARAAARLAPAWEQERLQTRVAELRIHT